MIRLLKKMNVMHLLTIGAILCIIGGWILQYGLEQTSYEIVASILVIIVVIILIVTFDRVWRPIKK